jgi:hypothetical protein
MPQIQHTIFQEANMTPYNQIAKQVIDFQKISFSSIYDAVATLQDQTVNTVDKMMDQTTWLPDEGRKAMRSWVSACQSERDRLKSFVDDGFNGLEKYIDQARTASATKTKKSS